MYRRKVLLTTVAVFAIGVAFAAQPPTHGADWRESQSRRQRTPWVPGADSPMSAHEPSVSALSPPR
jgi:hypothetical protein